MPVISITEGTGRKSGSSVLFCLVHMLSDVKVNYERCERTEIAPEVEHKLFPCTFISTGRVTLSEYSLFRHLYMLFNVKFYAEIALHCIKTNWMMNINKVSYTYNNRRTFV